jgi:glycosyltransferase involved in cell wall biosynthesis
MKLKSKSKSTSKSLVLVVPGRLETLTGGYGYDRRIVAGLAERGWSVAVRELGDGFPFPTPGTRADAGRVLASIPDGATVLVDGLALGALPEEAEREAARLRLVALVHHPLAAETGVEAAAARELAASERRALAAVRCVVVTSRATAAALGPYGVGPERIDVVEPGTDRAPLASGSRDGFLQLLCVAALVPRKGHDVLFRALASIPYRRWRLSCVGSLERHPATVAQLRVVLRAEGLDHLVRLAGEADGAALGEYYAAADVFVLPTWYEGYGMAAAEALARGLPVIGSSTGAIADLVGDDAGLVVPAGDVTALSLALSQVLGDDDRAVALREKLARGARRVREGLPTWNDAARRMDDLLTRLAR